MCEQTNFDFREDSCKEVLCDYYSFFATCRLSGINPEEWLTFVLGHITDAKPSQYINLLPTNFHPELFD